MKLLVTGSFFTLCLLIAASCGNDSSSKTPSGTADGDTLAYVDPGTFDFDTICGIYSGKFGNNELRLVINFASEGHAVGYNIVKGLQRNICGKVKLLPETVEMELAEPGDDKNDGVFKLSMNRSTLQFTGTWTPNDKKLKPRTFTLDRYLEPVAEDEVTSANIAYYLSYIGDTSGNFLAFEDDGYCTYEYYPGGNFDQKEEINGTWAFREQRIFIEWEPNPIFPSRSSVFSLVKDPEYNEYTLEGEGTVFSNYYF